MDRLVLRTGGWFALALVAFAAMLGARDGGFAVHMGTVSLVALGLNLITPHMEEIHQ